MNYVNEVDGCHDNIPTKMKRQRSLKNEDPSHTLKEVSMVSSNHHILLRGIIDTGLLVQDFIEIVKGRHVKF